MAKEVKLTPMMAQYRKVKSEVSADTLLMFRMGDFYELFFDDAARGSELMDIALTKRAGVSMAGIPYHALQNYLPKLLAAGAKVAIAEQVEDPKFAKGIVRREITQIITPGTIIDGNVLASDKSNILLSIATERSGRFGLASLDVSTGDFRLTEIDTTELLDAEIHRLKPAECVICDSLYSEWKDTLCPELSRNINWSPVEDWTFDHSVAQDLLHSHFDVGSLDGFGCRGYKAAIQAAGAILYYVQNNLRRRADHIITIKPYASQDYLTIDRISQRNLELIEPLFSDARDSTLLSVLNKTLTPMGSRTLREWIQRPLLDTRKIDARLDAVGVYVEDQLLLTELREVLRAVKDLERTISRLTVGSANGRDLLVLNQALEAVPGIKAILSVTDKSAVLNTLNTEILELPEVTKLIGNSIIDSPPLTVKEGGIISEGYNDYLDDLRSASREGKKWIAELQKEEQEKTGIRSLKVRYNKVFGYYIEISKTNLDLVPPNYTRKQTLVNAERFITPELKEIEDKIIGAEDKAKALEYELFQEVRSRVVSEAAAIQSNSRLIGELDSLASMAYVAVSNSYKRPKLTEEIILDINGGRHPVIDNLMTEEVFVPNDTYMNQSGDQILIITGPNMAGKSTYIRQVALLTIMAQMGSYIPAESAVVGIADRIFTRIGAADDLSRGQSTFMVEMLETANILNNATPKSLIILDEIGRGTSTFDGLSIAWAVAEFIHNNPKLRSRTLFATHYHELTELSSTMPGIKNYNIAVKESGDKIRFLRTIVPGPADQSYGIHVARLAGVPKSVLSRASEILENLEGDAIDEVSSQPKLAKSKKKSRNSVDHPTLFDD